MSYDKLTNLDSREGFVGFDSLNEFDNPVVRDEWNHWMDLHYPETDEDLRNEDEEDDDFYDEYDDYDDVNYIDQDDVDEYTEWQDYMGGDDSPYDRESDCENEW